jgi:hypothetical protein
MYRNHEILLHQSTRLSIRHIVKDEIHHAIAFSQESSAAPDTIVKRLNAVEQYLPFLGT